MNKLDKFEEFWEIYPRKIAKIAARKLWVRCVIKMKLDPEAIIVGARRYAAEKLAERLRLAAAARDSNAGHRPRTSVTEVRSLRAAACVGECDAERRTPAVLDLDTAVVTHENRLSRHRYSS